MTVRQWASFVQRRSETILGPFFFFFLQTWKLMKKMCEEIKLTDSIHSRLSLTDRKVSFSLSRTRKWPNKQKQHEQDTACSNNKVKHSCHTSFVCPPPSVQFSFIYAALNPNNIWHRGVTLWSNEQKKLLDKSGGDIRGFECVLKSCLTHLCRQRCVRQLFRQLLDNC